MRHLNASRRLIIHRYFSYAANCSSLILLTVFLLPCQLYFYYPVNCISLILPTVFLLSCQLYFSCPANRISLILNATGLLIIGQYFSYSTRCICQFYRLYFFDSVNLIISVIKQACLLGMTRDIWMRSADKVEKIAFCLWEPDLLEYFSESPGVFSESPRVFFRILSSIFLNN